MKDMSKILKKDPIIHTFLASEIVKNPERVGKIYSSHASTHMSLAENKTYLDRAIECLVNKKNTFVAGVTGEYGLGKTSLLVHFWNQMQKQEILAVPPYCWEKIEDNFRAIHSWVKFKIEASHPSLTDSLDKIYEKYTSPSLKKEAQKMSAETNAEINKSYSYIEALFSEGKLSLGLSANDLLDYLSDLNSFIVDKHNAYKGIIVFFDELQRTVNVQSLDTVAQIMFDLASELCDREGKYGFMIGMPTNTQAALSIERSDIFDRLSKYKCFITLEDLYGSSFAVDLWSKYATKFDFCSEEIVDPQVLIALGQITNSKRKDLGNGPRSVISAFNRIVEFSKQTNQPYGLFDLHNDLVNKEIMLGENSSYVERVQSVVEKTQHNQVVLKAIKIIACFPDGCPLEVIDGNGVEVGYKEFIQQYYGELIKETPAGHALISLLEQGLAAKQTVLDNRFIQFRNGFSPDEKHAEMAAKGFMQFVIPALFPGWDFNEPRANTSLSKLYDVLLTSEEDTIIQPERKVYIVINSQEPPKVIPGAHFTFYINLRWKQNKTGYSFKLVDKNIVTIDIDIITVLDSLSIPIIDNNLIPKDFMFPMFALSMIYSLKAKEDIIPQSEQSELDHIVEGVSSELAAKLVSSENFENATGDIKLQNAGQYLVRQLLNDLCKRAFPRYSPLAISSHWESRLNHYIALLQNENVGLGEKRGSVAITDEDDRKSARKKIADLLKSSPSNVESYMNSFDSLFNFKDMDRGKIFLAVHPAENEIISMIEKSESIIFLENDLETKHTTLEEIYIALRLLGYLDKEIDFVCSALGPARKMFKLQKYQGQEVLYKPTLNLEDSIKKFQDKLERQNESENFLSTVSSYEPLYSAQTLLESLSHVQNEEDLDAIKLQLKSSVMHDEIKMQDYFSTIQNDINEKKEKIEYVLYYIENNCGIVKRKVGSNVKWAPVLFSIQVEDLDGKVTTVRSLAKSGQKKAKELEEQLRKGVNPKSFSDIPDLVERFDGLVSLCDTLQDEQKTLSSQIQNLSKWHELASIAADIQLKAVKVRNLGTPQPYNKFEILSQNVECYLKDNQSTGLSQYEHFQAKYDDLQQEIDGLLSRQREKFMGIKQEACSLVKEIGADYSDIQKSLFDADEPEESYRLLTEATVKYLESQLEDALRRCDNLVREIRYSAEVSSAHFEFDKGELKSLTNTLDKKEDIARLIQGVNIQENEDSLKAIQDVVEGLTGVTQQIKDALLAYRKSKAEKPPLNKEEKNLIQQLTDSPSSIQSLLLNKDTFLEVNNLFELMRSAFEKGYIDIKLEKKK